MSAQANNSTESEARPPLLEDLESRQMLSGFANGMDADGDLYTITLKGPGSLAVDAGSVPGVIESIQLTGTTARSSLTIKVTRKGDGDGLLSVGSISTTDAASSLKSLSAAGVDLLGNASGIGLAIEGGLSSLKLHDLANGADVQIGTPGVYDPTLKAITVSLHAVGFDSSLFFSSAIGTLTAVDFAQSTLLDAAAIKTLKVSEHFQGSLNIAGNLGTATIGGWIGENWTVGGNGGTIKFGASSTDWIASFGGDVKSLTAKSTMSFTTFTADSVQSVKAIDMTAGTMILSGAASDKKLTLGKLAVTNWMDAVTVRAEGNIGSVTAGGMNASNVFAGVEADVDGLLSDLSAAQTYLGNTDFRIAKVVINGAVDPLDPTNRNSMIDSNIIAGEIAYAKLRGVELDNADEPFGLAARTFAGPVIVQQPVGPSYRTYTTYTMGKNWMLASPNDFEVVRLV